MGPEQEGTSATIQQYDSILIECLELAAVHPLTQTVASNSPRCRRPSANATE